jgi:hypothetical protein
VVFDSSDNSLSVIILSSAYRGAGIVSAAATSSGANSFVRLECIRFIERNVVPKQILPILHPPFDWFAFFENGMCAPEALRRNFASIALSIKQSTCQGRYAHKTQEHF